ncbi:MAG TPA: hypothetical protein VGL86_02070 [Polyangia bacterium]|jgi:hypothetical protein
MHKTTFALLALATAGCGPMLQYRATPPAPTLYGRVVVEVRDGREPKAGGGKHEEVGMQTGTFGIPDMITVDGPTTVADTMRQLVSDAARAAGIGVSQDGSGATARIFVDVQRLWCTGYSPAYKADVTASLSVMDPSGRQIRVPGMPIHAEDGGMKCKRVFRHALTDFFAATRAMLQNPNVSGSLVAK